MEEQDNIIIEPSVTKQRLINLNNVQLCPCTVRVLKFLIGSRNSELTIINQLLFQTILVKNSNLNLYNALKEIINETTFDLEFLGDAVIKFGGVLKFSNGQGTPWSARYLKYDTNVNSFLNNDIILLENVIKNYQRAINCVNNESLKNIFNDIIVRKNNQINIIKSYLN